MKEGARSISAILAVGGEQILRPRPKKKLILWEQTKMRLIWRVYLFAKNGFTKGCIDKATEMGNVTLVTYEDMLNP